MRWGLLLLFSVHGCDWPSHARLPDAGGEGSDGDADSDADSDTGSDGGDACDVDADGSESPACGGDDCDDRDPNRHPGGDEHGWSFEDVDLGDIDVSETSVSIAVDSDGVAHLTLLRQFPDTDSQVWYARLGPSPVSEAVSGTSTRAPPALAYDADGTAWLVYPTGEQLAIVHGGVGDWVHDRLASMTDEHAQVSIAPGTAGRVVAAYSSFGELFAARGAPDAFETEDLGSGVTPAVATLGEEAAIAYRSGEEIRLVHTFGGDWHEELVADFAPGAGGESVATSFAAGGSVHVAWNDADGLRYATDAFGVWRVETVVDAAIRPTIATFGDRVQIAYEGASGTLEMVEGTLGSFEPLTLGVAGMAPALAVAPDGTLHLAFFGDALRHAWRPAGADGIDQDCDGFDAPPACRDDADRDGAVSSACGGNDCDDADAERSPGAPDPSGDGVDADCDGIDGTDRDRDGFVSTETGGDDCDDLEASVHPAAPDPDDCVDDDCDGLGGADDDGDGADGAGCGGDDCDDADASTFPGAGDAFGDEIDRDCDGIDGVDADGDRFASTESGGPDCDDADAGIHPGAAEALRAWRREEVDAGDGTGASGSIALDGRTPRIAFEAPDVDEVRFASPGEPDWVVEVVDEVADGAARVSLAVDATGVPWLAYRENLADELRVATRSGGVWTHEPADAIGRPGVWTSIAIDAAGAMHVAYVDDEERETLEYATDRTGVWVIETVDAVGATGHRCALALDGDGAAHVSYGEIGDEDLRYATNASGTWAVETIDATGVRGYHSDLAIDPSGAIHVVYRAGAEGFDADGSLLHATNGSGVWAIDVVDAAPDAGRDPSLAVDADGHSNAVYIVDGEVRFAEDSSGAWRKTSLLDAQCSDTSIVLDELGLRHVAFRKGTTDAAFYATDTPLVDGIDQNCDGIDGIDADGDGRASIDSGGDDADDGTG